MNCWNAKLINMEKELKPGKVKQIFSNNIESKIYILKQLPIMDCGYWTYKVNLYTEAGIWNHIADVRCLINVD